MIVKPVSLPVKSLNVIHQWLPFESGLLYPFEIDASDADSRIEAMLVKSGFLSSNSKLSDNANEIFSVIANSRKTVKMKFLVDGDLMDYQIFLSKDKKSAASVKRGEKSFDCEFPAPTDKVIEVISEFSGMSSFGVINTHWMLSFSESMVMAALIDLVRGQIFSSLSEFKDSFEVDVDSDGIKRILSEDNVGSKWLSWVLSNFIPHGVDVASINVEESIDSLGEKNLLKIDGSKLIPCDDIVFLSRRLLHLNCLYMVDSFNILSEGNPEKSRFAVVQNGVRDLLMFETDGQSIAWQGISGKILLSLLQKELSATGPLACPSCNKSLKPNAKFCTGCGKTL